MSRLTDIVARDPSNSLFPYLENGSACRSEVQRLRKRVFSECLAVSQAGGRGLEVRLVISDLRLFSELDGKIKQLEERVSGIDEMFTSLDVTLEKVLAAGIVVPNLTPGGVKRGITDRRNQVWSLEQHKRETAAHFLGIDTYEPPQGTPEDLPVKMKSFLDGVNEEIKKIESEISILKEIDAECTALMGASKGLLVPPVEPEPVIDKGEMYAPPRGGARMVDTMEE